VIELIPYCDIGTAIEHERRALEFRPTAVVFARTNGLYLLVEPKKEESTGVFWPVQGGIDSDTPHIGAVRELHEEVNLEVCPDRVTLLDGFRYRNGRLRDGYTAGKLLFGGFTEFDDTNSGCKNIKPNPEEIRSIRYASAEEILEVGGILDTNVLLRPKTALKAEFIRHLLNSLPQAV